MTENQKEEVLYATAGKFTPIVRYLVLKFGMFGDFCLIPIGTKGVSVAEYIAKVRTI